MPTWRCGHRRSPCNGYLGGATDAQLRVWASTEAENIWGCTAARELAERRQKCPACLAQDRRVRRAWALVIAAAVVVLLVGWRLHG